MAELINDELWNAENADVQILTLEHHMAAKRMGFSQLFDPLHGISTLKTGLLDGTNTGMRFFYKIILPVYESMIDGDKFATARLIKEHSPLLSPLKLKAKTNQIDQLKVAQAAVNSLFSLWTKKIDPSMLEVLVNVSESGLFLIPETLSIIAKRTKAEIEIITKEEELEEEESDDIINAWDETLKSNFSQVSLYSKYISGEGRFDTHQGVKGLEFPRVMVILDDEDARGFLFSYDKLFGVTLPSDRDNKNKLEGRETGFDRTLRLFYVTCSRAKESLAIVIYSNNPDLLVSNVISNQWFKKEEIVQW
jgi:DNA helicase-2/ATP-dependent DNA helicase PcrA